MTQPTTIAWRTDNPCTQTETYLHTANWASHLRKRPVLSGHATSVRNTVRDPDFAIVNGEGTVFKYSMGWGLGDLWLVVIEGADPNGAYFVKTMYFTKDIQEGDVLCWRRWPRRSR